MEFLRCPQLLNFIKHTLKTMPALPRALPSYTGPYPVGTVNIEAPCDGRLVHAATHRSNGEAAFQLDTVLFTLHYPASPEVESTRSRQRRQRWLLEPARLRGKGFARLANISNWIVDRMFAFLLWALVGGLHVPAEVDVPLCLNLPESGSADRLCDGSEDDNDSELKLRGTGNPECPPRYPVIIFSHGMAASRTDYTQLCGELAARAYVVAAIEHRDGSGPGSVVRRGLRSVLPFKSHHLHHDPPLDRSALQRVQLSFRQVEMEETVRVLRMLDNGEGDAVCRHNSRGEGAHLAAWRGRLDVNRVILAGHSYGATGVLRACSAGLGLPVAGCVALDPGKASGPLNSDIAVPLLVVHSHSWSRKVSLFMGQPHFEVVRELARVCLRRTGAAWFMTSLGTSHLSCTDVPVIYPALLGWATGATMAAREGVLQYVRRMQEFIDFVMVGERTGLLAQSETHSRYRESVLVPWNKGHGPRDWTKDWQIHVAPLAGSSR